MSKNVKRLISTLLAAGMLLSSFGVAFADTTEATTEAAATTAVTTEAVAQSDSYYEEAIGLLTKMGIFEGYEDGSIKPDSTITRAEMATVILRVMDITATSQYTGMFKDVDAGHWAASIIQTAANAGIINGMGDGTFAPDSPVTYEQAVKMLVCAIGYDALAKGLGGYPTGYIAVAARKDIEISKNAPGVGGQNATRGTVAKLVYNALNALYPVASGSNSAGVEYSTYDDVTVASKLHNVFKYEGVVAATSITTIDPSIELTKGQVAVDDVIFNRADVDMESYVGYKITVYYTEYNSDGDRTIIYVVPNKKNDTLVIEGTEIESITDVQSEDGKIEYRASKSSSKTRTAKLDAPTIIYNGKKLYETDIEDDVTVDDFIRPSVGSLTLNDYDGDGKYDVVSVEKYETVVAASSTSKTVTGKYNTPAKVDLDNTDDDKILTIIKDDKEIAVKNIKKWDVLTMKRSVNSTGDQVIDIQICNDTIEGKVSDTDEDDNGTMIVKIGGDDYKVDALLEASDEISVGTEGIFYLDVFGRIAGVDSAKVGKLSSGEQYGWMISAKKNEEADEYVIKLFTQGGEIKRFTMADKVSYWGPKAADESETLNFGDDEEAAGEVITKAFEYMKTQKVGTGTTKFQANLVKYALNSDDEIKTLIMPVVTANPDSEIYEDRVVIYNANLSGVAGSGTMIGRKFDMQDNMVQFNVPAEDIDDTDVYAITTANSTDYIGREGVTVDFTVAELDGISPGIVIKYYGSSTDPKSYTYGTADDKGWFMISDIEQAYDEASDEIVYKITGYANGNKVEYTTTDTTSVSVATDIYKDYTTTPVWTAATDVSGIANAYLEDGKVKDLTEFLAPGDIVGAVTSGLTLETVVKMLDMSDYVEKGTTIWGAEKSYNNTSRDAISMGEVVELDAGESVVFTTSTGENFAYDAGYYMVTYIVDEEEIDEEKQLADLAEGDVVISRIHRQGQREIFAIKFE